MVSASDHLATPGNAMNLSSNVYHEVDTQSAEMLMIFCDKESDNSRLKFSSSREHESTAAPELFKAEKVVHA